MICDSCVNVPLKKQQRVEYPSPKRGASSPTNLKEFSLPSCHPKDSEQISTSTISRAKKDQVENAYKSRKCLGRLFKEPERSRQNCPLNKIAYQALIPRNSNRPPRIFFFFWQATFTFDVSCLLQLYTKSGDDETLLTSDHHAIKSFFVFSKNLWPSRQQ